MMNYTTRYAIDPVSAKFHNDFEHEQKLLTGAVGVGKTFTCLMDSLFFCMRAIPPSQRLHTGARIGRILVFRRTYPRLDTTTLESMRKLFGPALKVKGGYPITAQLNNFPDAFNTGDTIDIEFILMAIGSVYNEDELHKLRSLEITCAYGNEISEYEDPQIISLVYGRCGRFPDAIKVPDPDKGVLVHLTDESGRPVGYQGQRQVIGDFNKGDDSHWTATWHLNLNNERPSSVAIHDYPAPVIAIRDAEGDIVRYEPNPEAESFASKQPGGIKYWMDQLELNKHNAEYVTTLILNKYTKTKHGKAVFQNFNPDKHIIREKLDINPSKFTVVGFDHSGLNPAMLFFQIGSNGVVALRELVAFDTPPDDFIHKIFVPFVVANRLNREELDIVCDPADPRGRSIGGDLTIVRALHKLGFIKAHPAGQWGRDPERMIRIVNESFSRDMLYLVSNLEYAVGAVSGGYVYKKLKANVEATSLRPDKDNKYSHISDALMLGVCHIRLGQGGGGNAEFRSVGFADSVI